MVMVSTVWHGGYENIPELRWESVGEKIKKAWFVVLVTFAGGGGHYSS